MVLKIFAWILLYVYLIQCTPVRVVIDPNVQNISRSCLNETRLDPKVLNNIMLTGNIPPQSETYLKFLECLYKKQDYFDDQGLVSYSTIEDYLSTLYHNNIVKKAIAPCESIQLGTSLGEKAYNATKCIIERLQTLEASDILETAGNQQ